MSVTSKLSRRDRQLAEWFRRNGFKHPYLTVAALRRANIKPQTAAALLKKESGKGRNIFGCDLGPGRQFCHQNVTEARVRKLLANVRAGQASNGVGPTQLTWPGYIERAQRAGGAHRPYVNMVTGFSIFRENVDRGGSLWAGAKLYNGAAEYADDFVTERGRWASRLRLAGFRV